MEKEINTLFLRQLRLEWFQQKIPPEKKTPDPKPNPIPNLTLTPPLTPHTGLFSGGIFSWHRVESSTQKLFMIIRF